MTPSARTVESSAPVRPVTAGQGSVVFSPAEIDASCRPLLILFTAGAAWLVLSTLFGLFASIKFQAPGMFAHSAWFTPGRLRPAAINMLIYGFAMQTSLAVLVWIFCRLGRIILIGQRTVALAALGWNFGVLIGFAGILIGASTGFEWLEMPRYSPPFLFGAFALIGVAALVTFHFRREPDLYPSHWYLFGGLFWFAWIYSVAVLLLLYFPVRGVTQAVVNAWYVNNLFYLWFAGVGLGIIFYFVPKLLGVNLRTRALAAFAFWTLAIFGAWNGMALLMGGPIPAWLLSVSVYANVLLVVPLLAIVSVLTSTGGESREVFEPAALRFIRFGAACFIVVVLLNILYGFPIVSRVVHFTFAQTARNLLALYGFVGMLLFGSVYYILPRVANIDWPSPKLIRIHYGCSAAGIGIIFVALTIGGIIQGVRMNLNTVDFISLGKSTVPFIGLMTLGFLVLLIGQVAFAKNVFTLLHVWGEPFRRAIIELIFPPRRTRV